MKLEELSDNQRRVVSKLTPEQQKNYLVAADVSKCASVRILVADKLPKWALETIDNGVCRAVLKSGGGQ